MFCRFFILRPVLSVVISLMILLAGGVAIWASPVEQYPNIVPPCLSITASFPGANSMAIANAVAAPIEDQMSGIANMIYMQSTSANGSNTVTLNVYFNVGVNLELVEADAINRINTAMPQLPTQVQQQGVIVRLKNPDLFIVIPFYSKTGYPDLLFISNYVQRYIYPSIYQIPGVGVVSIQGQRAFAMRAILDVNKMNYYNVGIKDIANAISDQNYQYAIGMNAMEPMAGHEKFNFLINPPGYYTEESQFRGIVLRAQESNAQIIRLEDVAKVKLDAQQYITYFYAVKKDPKTGEVHTFPATALLVYLNPGANQIQVKHSIDAVVKEAATHMPDGIEYYYHYDSSEFVILSIQAVISTLLIAFVLVFIVVMLFIQNIRGTIIPILAIPVSIIGAFAGTYALGFSINTMTLFGMVLAIGIVVDDAIVVLECVERIMRETGCNSTEAAINAMGEVAAPIIAIVLVLNAVFVPVAFLGGFSGVLMQQFAVTIAISVLLSGVVALTLTPTLCAIFLKNLKVKHGEQSKLKFFVWFNNGFERLKHGYMKIVSWNIDNIKRGLLIWLAVCISVVVMFLKIPTSLIPLEDMGYFYNTLHVTSGGSLDYNLTEAKKTALQMIKLPYVDRIALLGGLDLIDNGATKTNSSTLSTILAPYGDRNSHQDVNAAIEATQKIDNNNKDINATAFNQPPIRGMSPTGGVTFYLQAKMPVNVREIYEDSLKVVDYLQKNYPAVANAHQFYDISTPQLYVNLDARKAYIYGVTYASVYNSLQAIFGTYYVNYFTKWNDLYWVILQGDYDFRKNPELINTVYVKSNTGQMMPVGSLANMEYKNGPEVVTRLNDYLASQIVVNPNIKHGYTQGQVMQAIAEAVPKVVGKKYVVKWFGPAYQENLAGNQSVIAFTLGLIMVFLILAALYEMWTLPLAVIVVLPFALLGAAIMLMVLQKPNDVYFQISLLTLIGLSAKNAILILEFAIEGVRIHNMPFREAALHAAEVRFRPIIMTSIAFIFGAVPLAFATGAGANSQHSVGTGIIGGMLGSTCLATLFVPMFFVLAMQISESTKKDKIMNY